MEFHEQELVANICRERFFDFLVEFWAVIIQEEPHFNWHVEYLCDQMQIVAERVFRGEPKEYDLVINVPPGTTKSTICSQMFPAWVWSRFPAAKFICTSYAYQIAIKDSLRTRDLVQSEKYQTCFPDIQLREDENTKGLFRNTMTGWRLAAGVGGAITGLHGHFLIVDDPLNPEQAYSDAELHGVNRWMQTTLPSRKVDKKIVPMILIQQRLHQADPTGEILERSQGKGVKLICLPGEVTDNVSPKALRKYYIDGLLDPYRLPRDVLDEMMKDLGAYGYASQVLQDPVPLGGGTFQTDKLNQVEAPFAKIVRRVRSWDKAGTQGGGMYSAGVLMGLAKDGSYWILDVKRGQWGATQREREIRKTAEEDGDLVEIELEIEGGSGGKESGENTVRNLAGFRINATHPTGDKETRAYPFASQVGAGNVFILKRHWTKPYIEEMRFFPNSKYKDQIDASSAAFNRLARKKRVLRAI